jgi:hypothetical protein
MYPWLYLIRIDIIPAKTGFPVFPLLYFILYSLSCTWGEELACNFRIPWICLCIIQRRPGCGRTYHKVCIDGICPGGACGTNPVNSNVNTSLVSLLPSFSEPY